MSSGASPYIYGAGVGYEPPDTDPDPTASGIDAADRLQAIVERASDWPVWSADRIGGIDTGTYAQAGKYGKSLRDIALWIAFRENDREAIIQQTHWERDRMLHIDPMPERICDAYSGMLFGEEPDFFAENDSDQDTMDEMVNETGLADELARWTDIFVSEGECWWRAWTDRDASEWPLIDGMSRINVVPLFVGKKIVAAAFIDDVLTQEIKSENQVTTVHYRHIEIQATGYVRNLLYEGSYGGLGRQISLTTLPETENLDEDWRHGLPVMLAGRIPFKLGRDPRLGISAYQGIRDLLMDLNEARTISAENARLVLKARMVVPANAVDADGNFDAGKDVIVQESLDEELAGKNSSSYAVLEYNFRARELIEHKNELVSDIMARTGLAEQFSGGSAKGGEGQAFTGTALRTRLIPTIQAAKKVAKGPDREVPKILRALALLSALSTDQGGCGQDWSKADGKHYYQRATILPEDDNEKTQRHVMGVQGEVESIETAVRDLHPDWTDDEVEEEVERIKSDHTVGPTFGDPDEVDPNNPNIPPLPPGGPGSRVPTPSDVVGSSQPGAGRLPDGQSPGGQAPRVPGGGPT